jgi:hypothetical protein
MSAIRNQSLQPRVTQGWEEIFMSIVTTNSKKAAPWAAAQE